MKMGVFVSGNLPGNQLLGTSFQKALRAFWGEARPGFSVHWYVYTNVHRGPCGLRQVGRWALCWHHPKGPIGAFQKNVLNVLPCKNVDRAVRPDTFFLQLLVEILPLYVQAECFIWRQWSWLGLLYIVGEHGSRAVHHLLPSVVA